VDVGAEEAHAPVVEDKGDRVLAAGQGVGVGGLPRATGPEDEVERGWHDACSSSEAQEQLIWEFFCQHSQKRTFPRSQMGQLPPVALPAASGR
jgi:hypothetical protein